ncbi:MAG: TonB-dependent receptor [Deltaproteobacteria bacterium]|nr:MAG: TonB-dependent receptor [Deltaproteobacteria bacterium]
MFEATVLIDGVDRPVRTGVDGRFAVALPEGEYIVRIRALGYRPEAYSITVEAGEASSLGVVTLRVDRDAVETFVVEGRADRSSAAMQMLQRRENAAVSDGISAEEIARSPDSSAGDSARRVVAATLVDGRYLYVRGLGDRYTNVLLNGAMVPSLDPDFPGVQLDLFPASVLAGLAITKTATPDLPASWAGGLMDITTRDFPEDFTLELSVGVSGETGSTFRSMPTHGGGRLDWLAMDDGTRRLPAAVPADRAVRPGRTVTPEEAVEIGRSFPNVWSPEERTALPGLRLGATVGGPARLLGVPMGYLVSLGWSHSHDVDEARVRLARVEGIGEEARVVSRTTLEEERGTVRAQWGGLGTLAFELSRTDHLTLVTLVNRSAEQTTRLVEGFSDAEAANIEQQTFRWVERSLWFTQLLGRHTQLPADSDLDWQVNLGLGSRSEPDTRDLTYIEGGAGYAWRNAPGSSERFFSELSQLDLGSRVDLLSRWHDRFHTKVGGSGRVSQRSFDARRFRFDFIGRDPETRLLPPEALFAPENIGTQVELSEVTTPTDSYESEQWLGAGYALVDVRLLPAVRVATGARAETFRQSVEATSPFAQAGGGASAAGAERTEFHVLPSANLTWELQEDVLLRAGYAMTLAYPQVREVAPFLFQDYVRRRSIQGNPDLETTRIHNMDLRLEYFPGAVDVLAVSAFVKVFEDPIESTILDQNGNQQWRNIDGATNFGMELEGRVGLGALHEALSDFFVGSNLTLVHSRVEFSEEQLRNATNRRRPLAGQSPWVANANLGWSHDGTGLALVTYYNVFGPRIRDVGAFGLPDIYEQPVHQLDLTATWDFAEQWRLRLVARNLLNQSSVERQGSVNLQEVRPGTSLSATLRWSF